MPLVILISSERKYDRMKETVVLTDGSELILLLQNLQNFTKTSGRMNPSWRSLTGTCVREGSQSEVHALVASQEAFPTAVMGQNQSQGQDTCHSLWQSNGIIYGVERDSASSIRTESRWICDVDVVAYLPSPMRDILLPFWIFPWEGWDEETLICPSGRTFVPPLASTTSHNNCLSKSAGRTDLHWTDLVTRSPASRSPTCVRLVLWAFPRCSKVLLEILTTRDRPDMPGLCSNYWSYLTSLFFRYKIRRLCIWRNAGGTNYVWIPVWLIFVIVMMKSPNFLPKQLFIPLLI